MRKSKRQHQVDLLEKLLKRVQNNDTDNTSQQTYDDTVDWIRMKMQEVEGGDISLDSGGLSKEDMLKANTMWTRHSKVEATS